MSTKILIFGLPGSGKTTLAKHIKDIFEFHGKTVEHLNADELRKEANDWDFTPEGRERQAFRMNDRADESSADIVIMDFVAPTTKIRMIVRPDYYIFMDTIEESRYEDTNKMFQRPIYEIDFHIKQQDCTKYGAKIADMVMKGETYPKFDLKKPTTMMLGRYQPWHPGHRALFERALAKTGQVAIMIRDTHDPNDPSNPLDVHQVVERIHADLEIEYKGRYIILGVPNIVNITYGRDVGYKIEKETFDADIESISATKIRASMK